MNIEEIKKAVREGKKVHWSNEAYIVTLGYYRSDKSEQWSILCIQNDHMIGLTNLKGDTLNGKEEEFFIAEESG
jgi:co-chaperonin GroES (HSP10)